MHAHAQRCTRECRVERNKCVEVKGLRFSDNNKPGLVFFLFLHKKEQHLVTSLLPITSSAPTLTGPALFERVQRCARGETEEEEEEDTESAARDYFRAAEREEKRRRTLPRAPEKPVDPVCCRRR